MILNPREMDVLAAIVFNVWSFFTNGCQASLRLFCKARAEELPASKIFCLAGQYVFVRPDSLPFDPNIKSVGLNPLRHGKKGRLYIETTKVDWAKAGEQITDARVTYEGLEIRGRTFYWRGQPFLQTKTQQHFQRNVNSPRTLFYTAKPLLDTDPEGLVLAADLIYGHTCFAEEAIPRIAVPASAFSGSGRGGMRQEMVMQMRQEMVMLLRQEQKPIMTQTMYMQASLFYRQRVLRMGRNQLERFIRHAVSTNPVLQVGKPS